MKTHSFDKMKDDLKGHIKPFISYNSSGKFIHEPILLNAIAYIMKTQIFYEMRYDLKGHFYVDLITTLTYVLTDNFCPCLLLI